MALDKLLYPALKAAIIADPVLNALVNNEDGNDAIAKAFNLDASPSFTVWKSLVPLNQVGMAINFAELANLTAINSGRVRDAFTLSPNGINPYLADRRAAFDDIFSGAVGTTTRAQLLVLWKRFATRAEKLYATGTGSDASPATLVFEGKLTQEDVSKARG